MNREIKAVHGGAVLLPLVLGEVTAAPGLLLPVKDRPRAFFLAEALLLLSRAFAAAL